MILRILSLATLLLLCVPPAFAGYSPNVTGGTQQEARMLFQLTNRDAETAIAKALQDKGAGDRLSAKILGRKQETLFSYNKPVIAEIHGLRYEALTHRWNASIIFRAGEDVVSAIPASGSYEEMIEVPVLRREVRNDAVITKDDVEMRTFPVAQTRSDTITRISDLLGKSPLRYISALRPIRTGEIAPPTVVERNSIVQLRFNSAGLHITATGLALEDGARGDVINVRNTASRRVVRAIVVNTGVVRVVAPGSLPHAALTRNTIRASGKGGHYATN